MYVIQDKKTMLCWRGGHLSDWVLPSLASNYAKPEDSLPSRCHANGAEPEFVAVGSAITRLIDTKCVDLHDLWSRGKQEIVIDLLANDHAGLAAVFLVQGIQDGTISRSMANTIANKLIEKRQEAFRAAGMLE